MPTDYTASQALREGAAKLRKEAAKTPTSTKRGLPSKTEVEYDGDQDYTPKKKVNGNPMNLVVMGILKQLNLSKTLIILSTEIFQMYKQ